MNTVLPKVGDKASLSKTLSAEDVRRFADLVGDHNPVHWDKDYARRTRFKEPIAHGMLVASLISATIATHLPGPGAIYLSQSLQFRAPLYLGQTVTAHVTVTRVRDDKPIVTLDTVCVNDKGETVISGEAVVLVEI